jgi:hypothetical protein
MRDGFGLVNPVSTPILERINRDERLGRDNPRRDREGKPKPDGMVATRDEEPAEPADSAGPSASAVHIDLRI